MTMVKGLAASLALAAAITAFALPVKAADTLDLKDSFRIGSAGNALCSAQTMPADKALGGMFDRGYALLCRDAAIPVGRLYALRLNGTDPAPRLDAIRAEVATCEAAATTDVDGLAGVEAANCQMTAENVGYRVYTKRQGDTLYVAEGLSGYDSVLRLGLRSLVANRQIDGEVSIATTGVGDPESFARIQAGNVSPQRALAEAYRRNNSGSYAEAAEFFSTLGDAKHSATRAEALANAGLQRSNLGAYAEAESLFSQAQDLVGNDPVVSRQLRNYRAMHLLNQGMVAEASAELDRPMPAPGAEENAAIATLVIDSKTADQLSSETNDARKLGAPQGLSALDKAAILDAQALQLKGSSLRLEGKNAEAKTALRTAQGQMVAVRDGHVAATVWMQAQIMAELAEMAEEEGNNAEAESLHETAIKIVEVDYPGTSTLLTAKGKLAAFYARTGRTQEALTAYRAIVDSYADTSGGSAVLARVFGPYFTLLTSDQAPPNAAAELFRASQMMTRPSVAQTQAILARELSGGSDEAARLFRQSVNLTRDIERSRVELGRAQLSGTAQDAQKIPAMRAALQQAEADQLATQAQLAAFPRYRALSNARLTLEELQAMLRPGEAYYKMTLAGGDAYALFVTPQSARVFQIGSNAQQIEQQVDAIRGTISAEENGQLVTLPFDIDTAHKLYESLFGPVSAEVAQASHLIFEPDGAMLRLPPNLLVMDQASVDSYNARAARPNDDGFDFRGTSWLGRQREISTSVSARAFHDLRQAPPSRATAQYVGFGQNQPADAFFLPSKAVSGGDDCTWSLSAWGRPISADELYTARRVIAAQREGEADIVTGKAFSDEAIKARTDLDQYRIVHFATHGMLTPPRPDCPTRPALMTSFGGPGSDGLLSFGEIFDLRLDADVVILSACDTAGGASRSANREAGVTGGGEFALDGLVRAFVGAGGRMVIASHWPVPDDYDATKRLISGLFAAPPGTSTGAALRATELSLMDDVNTSHPFYWSGFAIVGDGAAAFIRPTAGQTASLN
jgi:CHAT domain-containing protein